jgi:diacylglycerol kinase family enzyme
MQTSRHSDPIVCILNGKAGAAKALDAEERLGALFTQHGAQATIIVAQEGDDIAALARQAIESGCKFVVAGGGDGTVNAVASVLVDTKTVLGVLPLGTLNHFAKDLKIPLTLDAAVATLFVGRATQVDIGEVNGQRFVNNSSLGLYPTIVRQRESLQARGGGKWGAFARASIHALLRYPRFTMSMQVKGVTVAEETPFVFIGNNRYEVSGLHLGERSRMDEGRLWIYLAPRATRLKLLGLALQSLIGRPAESDLRIFDAPECRVARRRKHIHVATDGEVTRLVAPLHYRILPGALCVMVPADE